jgi:hypothetical protein
MAPKPTLLNGALFPGNCFNWDIIGNPQYALVWLAMLINVLKQEKAAPVSEVKSEDLILAKTCFWNKKRTKVGKVVSKADYFP